MEPASKRWIAERIMWWRAQLRKDGSVPEGEASNGVLRGERRDVTGSAAECDWYSG